MGVMGLSGTDGKEPYQCASRHVFNYILLYAPEYIASSAVFSMFSNKVGGLVTPKNGRRCVPAC